ncbi:hypothetical protein [Circoviridae sp.]|nr:hypothetical protein [Circoviridae sp.]
MALPCSCGAIEPMDPRLLKAYGGENVLVCDQSTVVADKVSGVILRDFPKRFTLAETPANLNKICASSLSNSVGLSSVGGESKSSIGICSVSLSAVCDSLRFSSSAWLEVWIDWMEQPSHSCKCPWVLKRHIPLQMSGSGVSASFWLITEVFGVFGDEGCDTIAMLISVVVDGEAPSTNSARHDSIYFREIVTRGRVPRSARTVCHVVNRRTLMHKSNAQK